MPASVLIPPDNRLLGWALSDLTLYGAQPATSVVIGRAPEDLASPSPSHPADPSEATSASPASEAELAAFETTAVLDQPANQPAAAPATAAMPATAAVPITPTPAAASDAASSQPHPAGAGSAIPSAPLTTPLHATEVQHQPDAAAPLVHDVVGSGQVDVLAHSFDALLSHAAGEPLGVVDTVLTGLDSAATAVPGHAIGALGELPESLSAFGGSDPAAGIHTLIGMVDSADAFDLGHAITPGNDQLAGTSILDALGADDAPAALLGGDHGDSTHVLDDHGLHIGG